MATRLGQDVKDLCPKPDVAAVQLVHPQSLEACPVHPHNPS